MQIAQEVRKSSRSAPKDMEQIILNLCRGRWLSRKQLGDLLGRNPDGLRSRFLTQMVHHGLLHLRYNASLKKIKFLLDQNISVEIAKSLKSKLYKDRPRI